MAHEHDHDHDHDEKVKVKVDVPIENSSDDLKSAIPELGTPQRLLAERKLVRKLDSRLLPTIVVIYIMNYID
ncbi:hypothetical protein H0H93_003071, partial [Arthromyces matolae]